MMLWNMLSFTVLAPAVTIPCNFSYAFSPPAKTRRMKKATAIDWRTKRPIEVKYEAPRKIVERQARLLAIYKRVIIRF